jgi:hypothetical protein
VLERMKNAVKQLPEPIPQLARRAYMTLTPFIRARLLSDPAANIPRLYIAAPHDFDAAVPPADGAFMRFIGMPADGAGQDWDGMLDYLKANQSDSDIAIIGDSDLAADLERRISASKAARSCLRLSGFNAMFTLRQRRDIRTVVLLCNEPEHVKFLRGLVHAAAYDGELIIPATRDGLWPSLKFEDPRPIVQCAYPCAGTNRFTPSFLKLMEHVDWENFWFSPFMRNVHALGAMEATALKRPPSLDEADEAIFWRTRALDYNQMMTIHEWVGLSKIKDLDCRVVVLMRDPRDIINSYFWHTKNETDLSPEEHLLQIIEGYCRFHHGEAAYAFQWPDAGKLVDCYVTAKNASNMHIIRFEDLHVDAPAALKKLMQGLALERTPFFDFTDQVYEDAAYLGTFEYQTGGQRKRGEDHKGRPGGEHSGISARKGIVGDWRSSFTPRAVRRFKELTGNGLYELGYETNRDWDV